jgi:hypothetical protein
MSLSIANARLNVRINLGDLDEGAYAIDNEQLTRILVRQAQLHNALAGLPDRWATTQATGALAISDTGSPDFSFDEDFQFDGIEFLRRASDGYLLTRRTRDEIERLRATTTPATGPPTDYYLHEATGATGMAARLHPRPIAADTLHALVHSIATSTTGPAYTDATVLEGSDYLLRAIELATASEVLLRMVPAERERIKLSADAAALWKADAAMLLDHERTRKSRLRAVSHIPAQVN